MLSLSSLELNRSQKLIEIVEIFGFGTSNPQKIRDAHNTRSSSATINNIGRALGQKIRLGRDLGLEQYVQFHVIIEPSVSRESAKIVAVDRQDPQRYIHFYVYPLRKVLYFERWNGDSQTPINLRKLIVGFSTIIDSATKDYHLVPNYDAAGSNDPILSIVMKKYHSHKWAGKTEMNIIMANIEKEELSRSTLDHRPLPQITRDTFSRVGQERRKAQLNPEDDERFKDKTISPSFYQDLTPKTSDWDPVFLRVVDILHRNHKDERAIRLLLDYFSQHRSVDPHVVITRLGDMYKQRHPGINAKDLYKLINYVHNQVYKPGVSFSPLPPPGSAHPGVPPLPHGPPSSPMDARRAYLAATGRDDEPEQGELFGHQQQYFREPNHGRNPLRNLPSAGVRGGGDRNDYGELIGAGIGFDRYGGYGSSNEVPRYEDPRDRPSSRNLYAAGSTIQQGGGEYGDYPSSSLYGGGGGGGEGSQTSRITPPSFARRARQEYAYTPEPQGPPGIGPEEPEGTRSGRRIPDSVRAHRHLSGQPWGVHHPAVERVLTALRPLGSIRVQDNARMGIHFGTADGSTTLSIHLAGRNPQTGFRQGVLIFQTVNLNRIQEFLDLIPHIAFPESRPSAALPIVWKNDFRPLVSYIRNNAPEYIQALRHALGPIKKNVKLTGDLNRISKYQQKTALRGKVPSGPQRTR